MYTRILNVIQLLSQRSYFLFGPRGTGKSTLIDQTIKKIGEEHVLLYDLLNPVTYHRLARNPGLISSEAENKQITTIIIDEIQKMPNLLDEVQLLIHKKRVKFLLTGSSARKLKHGASNLLAARAYQCHLFPLIYAEIPNFDLLTHLNSTAMPEFAHNIKGAKKFFNHYIGTYLKEEIMAEAQIRNLPAFTKFLEVVALSNSEEISYTSLASDTGVSIKTLENYFSILEDTLLGLSLPAFTQSKKRKAITRSKFYLFDIGLVNNLTYRGKIELKSELFGKAFEHFIVLEIKAYLSYKELDYSFCYWRSVNQFEVDLIIGNKMAIEIKGTDIVQEKHLKGLRALMEENLIEKSIIVSLDQNIRQSSDGITIYPWEIFLKTLWGSDDFFNFTF